jgi:hypothetical protein
VDGQDHDDLLVDPLLVMLVAGIPQAALEYPYALVVHPVSPSQLKRGRVGEGSGVPAHLAKIGQRVTRLALMHKTFR